MLHDFLVLPWQDLHLQAPVNLAGHTARMTGTRIMLIERIKRIFIKMGLDDWRGGCGGGWENDNLLSLRMTQQSRQGMRIINLSAG